MCTVSWFLAKDGYQVFFNRDEQKGRALAHKPRYFNDLGVKYLMPVDPVGGGSWIAMNQAGLSVCLLNYYQQKDPGSDLISRGLLVKSLVSYTSITQIRAVLSEMSLKRYAAFTLMVFPANLSLQGGAVSAFRWDGNRLCEIDAVSPMVSSSVSLEEVANYRADHHDAVLLKPAVLFSGTGSNDDLQDAPRENITPFPEGNCAVENVIELTNQRYIAERNSQALRMFHASHDPNPSYLSVCMHRDDAHTVSFTHLEVSARQLNMTYVSGCPCASKDSQTYVLYPHRRGFAEMI